MQLSTLNTCPSVTTSVNPLCLSNDTSNVSFEERVCTCPPQCKVPPSSAKKSSVSPVVAGVAGGGGAFAFILFVGLIICCCRRGSQARKIDNQGSGLASNILSPKKGSTSTSESSNSNGWWLRCLGCGSNVSNVALPNSTFSTTTTRYDFLLILYKYLSCIYVVAFFE